MLYKYYENISYKVIGICAGVGLVLVIFLNYIIKTSIVFGLWRTTSFPVVLWALSWVMFALYMKQPEENGCNIPYKVMERIGKASYYVFLTQMIYYFAIRENWVIELPVPISILICSIIGVIYGIFDDKIRKRVRRFLNEQKKRGH